MKLNFKPRGTRSLLLLALAVAAFSPKPSAASAQVLFTNMNNGGVLNHAPNPAFFGLVAPANVTQIVTYHWNNGQGAPAGTISLRHNSGQVFGPFQAQGVSGQGGAPNVSWVADVNITIPPGYYIVLDSDSATQSYNPQSGNRGFATVRGAYLPPIPKQVSNPGTPPPPQTPVPFGGNCRGAGCTHPNLTAFGGCGAFPASVNCPGVSLSINPQRVYWIAQLAPYTSVASLVQQCNQRHGQLRLIDDQKWYYYFSGRYARFACTL